MSIANPPLSEEVPRSSRRLGTWGAIALSLLVFSGQLKATVLFSWLPIDLTLVTAGFVGLSMARSRFRGGAASLYWFLPILLWLAFLLPLIYSPPAIDFEKVALLFTVTFILATAPFYILRTEPQRRAFLWATAIIALVSSTVILTTGTTVQGYASRYIIEGTDSIGTARVAASGAVVCLLFALTRGLRVADRTVGVAAGAGLMMVALTTGSRGPVLAAAFAIGLATLFSPAFKKYRVRVAVAVATVGVTTFVIASQQSSDGFDRILSFFSREDESTIARNVLSSEALSIIEANPGGIGWGNFSIGNGQFRYPHNLFLEVPMEGGWLAAIIMFVILAAAAVRYLLIPQDPTQVIMFALLVFAAINASVSSDVNGNRLLWVAMFAAFAVRRVQSDDLNPKDSVGYGSAQRGRPSATELTPVRRR
ncbi:O-antigen ligase family protein [Microbacterium paraoxydans]|uniref:O-antigen ligase family protein n=1 Tax=Microbacterium paraoxydans TaxID=199592 RepID=UPI003013B71B